MARVAAAARVAAVVRVGRRGVASRVNLSPLHPSDRLEPRYGGVKMDHGGGSARYKVKYHFGTSYKVIHFGGDQTTLVMADRGEGEVVEEQVEVEGEEEIVEVEEGEEEAALLQTSIQDYARYGL